MKIENNGTGYAITRDDGTVIELTWNEVSLLVNRNLLDTLRSNVADAIDTLTDLGEIDPEKFDGGLEGFIEEITSCFSDDVECEGRVPDIEDIEDRIRDEARWYDGVLIGEEG